MCWLLDGFTLTRKSCISLFTISTCTAGAFQRLGLQIIASYSSALNKTALQCILPCIGVCEITNEVSVGSPAPLLYIYLRDGRTLRLPLLEWKQTHIFLAPGKLGTPAITIYCYILLYIAINCYILLYIAIYCYIFLAPGKLETPAIGQIEDNLSKCEHNWVTWDWFGMFQPRVILFSSCFFCIESHQNYAYLG